MVAPENANAPRNPNQFCRGWTKRGDANIPRNTNVVSLPISLPLTDSGTTDIIQRLELGMSQPVPMPSNITVKTTWRKELHLANNIYPVAMIRKLIPYMD